MEQILFGSHQLNDGQNVSFLRQTRQKRQFFGPPFRNVPAPKAPCCSKYSRMSDPIYFKARKGGSNRILNLFRFLACVAAGMRPEAVMDEEGKRTRFRKAIKKRAAKETNGDQLDPASSSGELRLSFGSR